MKEKVIFGTLLLIQVAIGQHIGMLIPCKENLDCVGMSTTSKEALCGDGFCVCFTEEGQRKNCTGTFLSDRRHKTRQPLVSRTCSQDIDCHLEHGFCNTTMKQCTCRKGFVASSNKQKCLKAADSLKFPCIDDKQCLAFMRNTTCLNETCVCGSGYHEVNNTCWRMADFGGVCKETEECSHMEGAFCNNIKMCVCGDNKMINTHKTRCLSMINNYGDECVEDLQCSVKYADTACINNTCQCTDKYHYEPIFNRCIISKGLEEYCKYQEECYQPADTNSSRGLICLAGVCECAPNYDRQEGQCRISDDMSGSEIIGSSFLIVLVATLIGSLWS